MVVMSSLNGMITLARSRIYGAVKAGLLHYGLALRADMKKHNVQVSVICPGWVTTPLTDKNSFKMPFKLPAAQAANKIASGLAKNKAKIIFPWQVYYAIKLTHLLPRFLQEWIHSRAW